MIRGIHHISMKCGTPEEFSAAKAFYCGLLGMYAAHPGMAGRGYDRYRRGND